MQVTHQQDHVTHCVIGGKETINFGISSSAEFFNILSSTLYKDQILAVVREVLCNAWDAHIEAKCTDRPIEITLTPEKFTVKDYGHGIHHEDIGLIYGTYGNSTKKNDGTQTGGFGLGCKAPFAYTDHFEVISCNGGIKTIYAMAKSSAQVGGKPGITPLAQFNHDETGLSVSINLKSGDFLKFEQLVKRIASEGDMNVSLNHKLVTVIGFDTTKSNWMIRPLTSGYQTRFMVRYGNVIYPIDWSSQEKLVDAARSITGYLRRMEPDKYGEPNNQIIFQAPPHSIAVTPSRESLSMQEHTIDTLSKLFKGFLADMQKSFDKEAAAFAKEVVNNAVQKKYIHSLLNYDSPVFLAYGKEARVVTSKATDAKGIAVQYVSKAYPSESNFRLEDMTYRVSELAKAGLIDRGMASTYLEAIKHKDNAWLLKRVIGKLAAKLSKAGLPNRLYISDRYDNTRRDYPDEAIPAKHASPKSIFHNIAYLRNIIVLTTSKKEVLERYQKAHSGGAGFMFYVVGRKKDDLEIAKAFFASTKMTIVDLTKSIDKPIKVVDENKVVKPKKKGLAALTSVMNGWQINTRLAYSDAAKRIEEPEFVIRVHGLRNDVYQMFPGMGMKTSQLLVELFGDKGGIATHAGQHDSWLKKTKTMPQYVEPLVLDYISKSANIQKYLSISQVNLQAYCDQHDFYDGIRIIRMIYRTPVLMKTLGLVDPRTDEEKAYYELFMDFFWNQSDASRLFKQNLDKIPLDPKLIGLLEKANKSKLIKCISMHDLESGLISTLPQRKKYMQMFFYALNN